MRNIEWGLAQVESCFPSEEDQKRKGLKLLTKVTKQGEAESAFLGSYMFWFNEN